MGKFEGTVEFPRFAQNTDVNGKLIERSSSRARIIPRVENDCFIYDCQNNKMPLKRYRDSDKSKLHSSFYTVGDHKFTIARSIFILTSKY